MERVETNGNGQIGFVEAIQVPNRSEPDVTELTIASLADQAFDRQSLKLAWRSVEGH